MNKAFNEMEYFLHNLELDKNETKTYLILLKNGPQSYEKMKRLSKFPEKEIYSILEKLSNKGWVKITNKEHKISPKYPEKPLKKFLMEMKEFYSLAVPF